QHHLVLTRNPKHVDDGRPRLNGILLCSTSQHRLNLTVLERTITTGTQPRDKIEIHVADRNTL
ncbi:MAG TPA: hypothetical protein DCE43_07590, partial [Planctomycetaceae bacterium]|nr:hypothetical protein [Planctomycetaceae bacterium]